MAVLSVKAVSSLKSNNKQWIRVFYRKNKRTTIRASLDRISFLSEIAAARINGSKTNLAQVAR